MHGLEKSASTGGGLLSPPTHTNTQLLSLTVEQVFTQPGVTTTTESLNGTFHQLCTVTQLCSLYVFKEATVFPGYHALAVVMLRISGDV